MYGKKITEEILQRMPSYPNKENAYSEALYEVSFNHFLSNILKQTTTMKTIITLTTLLTLVFSTLLITGLNNYKNALQAIQLTDGSDIEITDTLCSYGFNLDVFEQPTTIDYITSNFK